MIGWYDYSAPDWYLAGVLLSDGLLQTVLEFPAEKIGVQQIDAAIHETKTVGWTQNRVRCLRQNVLVMDKHVRRGPETGGPSVSHLHIEGTQMELNWFWR
jgi:hypothetical protein